MKLNMLLLFTVAQGQFLKKNMSNELEVAYKDKMKEALETGYYFKK